MKSLTYAAFAVAIFFVTHVVSFGQVNNVRVQRHPHNIVRRAAKDPAMQAAARDAHQAHLIMKAALPIYDGHRALAMELCGQADRDIKEGLKGVPAANQVNFSMRKPPVLDKSREKKLSKYSPGQIQASNAQMQNAVPAIQSAIKALGQAAGDYGGYRTQAANALNQALQEIQTCLQLRGGRQ